ncbi:MAG: TolC family protein [Burkholderiaceae bacterium]|nr:TolC family protein [Burkholderiaceae bacterium]
MRAAVARRDQAAVASYPTFSLAGSMDWRAPRLTDLLDASALSRALVASVGASLFDGGANRAREQAQMAALEQARIALEAAWLSALQEVEGALLSLQSSQQRVLLLTEAAAAAARAEDLARQRYQSGLIDTRALLDAQRTRLNAESEQVTALATRSADHVRLIKALGGGWSRDELAQDMKASRHEDH